MRDAEDDRLCDGLGKKFDAEGSRGEERECFWSGDLWYGDRGGAVSPAGLMGLEMSNGKGCFFFKESSLPNWAGEDVNRISLSWCEVGDVSMAVAGVVA